MPLTRTSLLRLIKILTAVILVGIIVSYAVWRSFNYARGPQIEIFEPINGSSTASSTLVIRGQASRINNLTLNGMPMYISEDGDFNNVVIIFPGINRITLAGYDQFGRQTKMSLEIVGTSEAVIPSPNPIFSPQATTTTATSSVLTSTSTTTQ